VALPRIKATAETQSPVVSAARAAAAKLAPRPEPKPAIPSTFYAIDSFKKTRAASPRAGVPRLVSLAAQTIKTNVQNNTRRPAGDANYAVQVGAFRLAKNAGELVRRLAKIGHEPETIERTDTGGRVLYIIRVGRFEERVNASRLVKRLKKDGHSAMVVSTN
jgi:cell division protein FtsN